MNLGKWIVISVISISMSFSAAVYAEEANVEEAAGSTVQGDAAAGKKLFDAICSYCHKLDSYDEKIGPGLKGITERVDEEWLNHWLNDTQGMLKTDEYAQGLREGNNYGMEMPQIPDMHDAKKRADIIEFLKTL